MSIRSVLHALASETPTTALSPRRFFVAWYGVLTLAFDGWPMALWALKTQIDARLPDLAPENPGSRWPHTTLGALHDDRTLTYSELVQLHRICVYFDRVAAARGYDFTIDSLQQVEMTCRSLEQEAEVRTLALDRGRFAPPHIPDTHAEEVAHIMAMFGGDRLRTYWPDVAKEGHRASHYREPCREASLIFRWETQQPEFVQDFIDTVETALPGAYAWFAPESRHVTLRTLNVISVP